MAGNISKKILFDFGSYRFPTVGLTKETIQNYTNNPKIASIGEVFECDDFLFCIYNYSMRLRFLLFNKGKKTILNGSILVNDMDFVPLLNPAPAYAINNKLYYVKNVNELHLQIPSLSSLKEDDNPVIAVFNLKTE